MFSYMFIVCYLLFLQFYSSLFLLLFLVIFPLLYHVDGQIPLQGKDPHIKYNDILHICMDLHKHMNYN